MRKDYRGLNFSCRNCEGTFVAIVHTDVMRKRNRVVAVCPECERQCGRIMHSPESAARGLAIVHQMKMLVQFNWKSCNCARGSTVLPELHDANCPMSIEFENDLAKIFANKKE